MFHRNSGMLRWALLCGALALTGAPARADEKEAKPRAEKTFAFQMKDAKWADVFDWYAKETGLKADVRAKPEGTFTFIPQKGREFTLGEITDLINEGLAEQKLRVLRGHKSFAVDRFDAKIDPKFVAAIELKDLSTRGRSELVEVAIPLTMFDEPAEEVADELKKLLTPFGEILVVKGRWVIIRDTVGNIVRIREVLERCCAVEPKDKRTGRIASRCIKLAVGGE